MNLETKEEGSLTEVPSNAVLKWMKEVIQRIAEIVPFSIHFYQPWETILHDPRDVENDTDPI